MTGVAGFIGSNLASRLLQEGYGVIGIDNLAHGRRENVPAGLDFHRRDIRDKKIYSLFKDVDTVFHLAAKNCIADCQADPLETAEINVFGTVNVFEASRRAGVRKVVYAESSALYEGSTHYPTPEWEVKPKSFYAASKLASRHFAEAYQRFHGPGLSFTALRYFCAYGPAQDYRRTIPPVISAFIIKLLKRERPTIYGTGQKRRDFIYIGDINDFHLQCLTDGNTDDRTFNLGSGANFSMVEIYNLLCELLGTRSEPVFKPDLPGEAQTTLADISEATKVGWEPRTDIRTGLSRAIEYIKGEMKDGRI